MTNKKNRFFTLVFSCCPGAGEMYMGLYKHGVSLMALFFGAFVVAFWLNWEELLILVCPVVWCYSFFHTHNLRGMTEEAFVGVEDRFFFENYISGKPNWQPTEKHRRLFGVILVVTAFSMLWDVGMDLLGTFYYVPGILWQFGNSIPQLAMAAVILYVALRMMKPKDAGMILEMTEDTQNDTQNEETVVE